MRIRTCTMVMVFLLTAAGIITETPSSAELTAIQEAYKAAMDNLVSGSGTGTYETYAARPGKETKMELRVKAKAKIFFDRGKFHIHLDYEKDVSHRLESRIIIYDGTAILVNKRSKYIILSHSQGEIYEAKPTLSVMRLAGFDYNPCELPACILRADLLSSRFSTALAIKPDLNGDYLGTFNIPPVVQCSFVASQKTGYHIVSYYESNTNHNNFQHVNRQATWEREKNIWYVKSIDNTWLSVDGSGDRTVFQYTTFEPNAEVSPSLFTFNALSLASTARVIDHRPNAEEPVLYQPKSPKVDVTKLDTLADTVKKNFAPISAKFLPNSPLWRKYALVAFGILFCILGLLLMWRRIRARKGGAAPHP